MGWSKNQISFLCPKVLLIALFCIAVSTSCQTENKKSILILVVDQISQDSLTCSEDKFDELSGLAILCKESVRFSNAYTTSLQPAAAAASLLTGLYPYEHQVHSSTDRLNQTTSFLTDFAADEGYKTAFFTAHPHILRKTGLYKKFDIFDDSTAALYSQGIIKPSENLFSDFTDWMDEDSKPYLALLHLADAQPFNDKDTHTTSFEKFDEKLYHFIIQLKSSKQWDNTTVIFTSLKGFNAYNRLNETLFSNLHSENTRIPLFIKSPRAKGDEGIFWKNDDLVNLADLGLYLKKLISKKSLENRSTDSKKQIFEKVDLDRLMNSNKKQTSDRLLLIESVATMNNKELNYAVLSENYLLIKKQQNHFFSLSSDRFESVDLVNPRNESYLKMVDLIQRLPFTSVDTEVETNLFKTHKLSEKFIKSNNKLNFFNTVKISVNNPLFVFYSVYLKNKKQTSIEKNPFSNKSLKCLEIYQQKKFKIDSLKLCDDPLFYNYIRWKFSGLLGINSSQAQLNYNIEKKLFIEKSKIAVWNLVYENIWMIHDANENWNHPLFYIDTQFLNHLQF